MKQKGFDGALMVILFLILIILGGSYCLINRECQSSGISDQTVGESLTMDIANWKTYENNEYDFEVKYPFEFDPKIFISVGQEPSTLLLQGTWSPVPYSEATSAKLIFSEDALANNAFNSKKDYWLVRAAGENEWFAVISFNAMRNDKYYSISHGFIIKDSDLPRAPYLGSNLSNEDLIKGTLKKIQESNDSIIFDKILSTFKFGIGINTGKVEINYQELEATQKSVDEGHQPWRLDPIMVATAESFLYGFTEADKNTITLADSSSSVVTVEITHNSQVYVISLIQPFPDSVGSIWVVSDVELK